MNDTNLPQEQNSPSQPAPENPVAATGHPHEKEIDLNALFPDAETDLNDLFPDTEIKHLLKGITKNKKDMNALKERLTTENQASDEEEEELTDDDPSGPDETEESKTD